MKMIRKVHLKKIFKLKNATTKILMKNSKINKWNGAIYKNIWKYKHKDKNKMQSGETLQIFNKSKN